MLLIAKVTKRRTGESIDDVRRITGEMADIAERTLWAARRVVQGIAQNCHGVEQRLVAQLESMLSLGDQVLEQARRVNMGETSLPERVVSIFDPQAGRSDGARPIREPSSVTRFG